MSLNYVVHVMQLKHLLRIRSLGWQKCSDRCFRKRKHNKRFCSQYRNVTLSRSRNPL